MEMASGALASNTTAKQAVTAATADMADVVDA